MGKKYPLAVGPWINHWGTVRTFFKFSEEIRTIIYTTDAVESLHRQFRKVTKNRSALPNNTSLFKLMYLAVDELSDKWAKPLNGRKTALSQFSILYGDRLQTELGD